MKTKYVSQSTAQFTLQKILGTSRIKVARVPQKVVLISHLHVFSSTVPKAVKLCFGTGKRLNISISFPEPTCHLVSAKTRSSGIIHFQTPRI